MAGNNGGDGSLVSGLQEIEGLGHSGIGRDYR